MQGMGYAAQASTSVCLIGVLLLLSTTESYCCCKGWTIRIGRVVTTAVWVIGTFTYVGFFAEIKSNSSDCGMDPGTCDCHGCLTVGELRSRYLGSFQTSLLE